MSLTAPLYCAICAVTCLLPRSETTPASPPESQGFHCSSDTTSSEPTHASPAVGSWEHEWVVLQVTKGQIQQFTIISYTPPSLQDTSDPGGRERSPHDPLRSGDAEQRAIPIHSYCLERVLKTIRKSIYNNGFSHEENMMLGWSLPKWTGYGPWVRDERSGRRWLHARNDDVLGVGYWKGMADQRSRYREGEEGSHLSPLDRVPPDTLSTPKAQAITYSSARPAQSSPLLQLPTHVLVQIAVHLLGDPDPNTSCKDRPEAPDSKADDDILPWDAKPGTSVRLLPTANIDHFLGFTRSSVLLRHLDVPSAYWRMTTTHQVQRWRLTMLNRWRANPTGVGSASNLWIALDEEVVDPIERIIKDFESRRRLISSDTDEDHTVDPVASASDVFHWWAYDPTWRSKRRVWSCVVHACATARDADWW